MELYTIEEAEQLKHAYSCWLNKAAHIGNGRIGILTDISVRKKRKAKETDIGAKKYIVEFRFSKTIKLSAQEFLVNNGLATIPQDFVRLTIYRNA